jgi:hypothetical protein
LHRLHGFEEILDGDRLRRAQPFRHRLQPAAQLALQLDAVPETGDVELEDLWQRELGPRQAVADLLQGEAQLPQRKDLQQAGDVVPVVEAVPGAAPL